MQAILDIKHYQAIMAYDATEAIKLYSQNQSEIQLVITDIMMPKVDGITLIHQLKAFSPQLKILAISGVSSHQAQALAAGADDFLAKPFDLNLVLDRIAALLQPSSFTPEP